VGQAGGGQQERPRQNTQHTTHNTTRKAQERRGQVAFEPRSSRVRSRVRHRPAPPHIANSDKTNADTSVGRLSVCLKLLSSQALGRPPTLITGSRRQTACVVQSEVQSIAAWPRS
jgi:hypothetical protein